MSQNLLLSIYKDCKKTESQKSFTLAMVIKQIREGAYRKQVESCRNKRNISKSEYDKEKIKLPAFSVSGVFKKRKSSQLEKYSQLIILDIDKISSKNEAILIRDKAAKLIYTRAAFLSPSGLGIKIIIQVSNTKDDHNRAFVALKNWYEAELKENIDTSGSDLARLCFFSYDPDIKENPNSTVFNYEIVQSPTLPLPPQNIKAPQNTLLTEEEILKKFAEIIIFTEKIKKFEDGNRNNFIFLLAGNLNRNGIPQSNTLKMISTKYESNDFNRSEIETIINSAYKDNQEFGRYLKQDSSKMKDIKKVKEADIQIVLHEYNIKWDKINDDKIIEILLLSVTNPEYEALFCFGVNDLISLLPAFEKDHHKKIISEIDNKFANEESYWISHTDKNIQYLANNIYNNKLTYEREEVYRMMISIHRVKLLDILIHNKILRSRFIAPNEVALLLNEINDLQTNKNNWFKEIEGLATYLLYNRL